MPFSVEVSDIGIGAAEITATGFSVDDSVVEPFAVEVEEVDL